MKKELLNNKAAFNKNTLVNFSIPQANENASNISSVTFMEVSGRRHELKKFINIVIMHSCRNNSKKKGIETYLLPIQSD